jgi:hypothetical protein
MSFTMTKGSAIRLALYISIAFLSAAAADLSDLTTESVKEMFWADWAVLGIGPVLAALISWRAFIDQHISNEKNKPPTQ